MVSIVVDSSVQDDLRNNNKKKNLVIAVSIVGLVLLLVTSFLLFYFLYLKNHLHKKFLIEVEKGFTVHLDSKDSGKLDKKLIYKKMSYYAVKKDIEIIKKRFQTCNGGSCHNATKDYVSDWKLKNVSEILEGSERIDLDDEFDTIKKNNEFIAKFNVKYKDEDLFKKGYIIFRKNKELIEEHNKNPDRLFSLDYNYFADFAEPSLTLANLPNRKLSDNFPKLSRGVKSLSNQIIHVDWRSKGVVSDVVMQGGCGSCWAISATDVFNSFMSIKKKDKLTFSYQQVLDCSSEHFSCKGGIHRLALEYIQSNPMCLNGDYKYKGKKGECKESMCETLAEFKEIRDLSTDDALEYLKNNGPFVTSFITNNIFMLYGDGIYNSKCGPGEGHSVLVVGHGYDEIKKVNYWIVKNSWSADWGEDGYFRILDSVKSDSGSKEVYCDFLSSAYGLI